MSTLVFDGTAHTLTLVGADGKPVGEWPANNRVDRRATFRFVPNQTFKVIDKSAPHRHGGAADTLNGPYGRFGIVRVERFPADGVLHDGVGVHSGRANKGGADHPTMGCIRTTDAGMAAIAGHMGKDPIQTLTVRNNHHHTCTSPDRGDPHPPGPHDDPPPTNPELRSFKADDLAAVVGAAVGGLAALAAVGAVQGGAAKQPQDKPKTPPAKAPIGRPDYVGLFETCVVNKDHFALIDRYAGKIIKNKAKYQALVESVEGTVPWWFVGLLHLLEASLSFQAHLHNGDPLSARTVQVPAGRPKAGSPPFTWEESAADALRHDGLTKVTDWKLEGVLHRLEGYNGYGYWKRGIYSPYLWSFSNHYTKGKYVSDGKYNSEAVSKQAGAAVVLKRLVERGAVTVGG